MIRSRTLSAGTGRIPARIFSRVSSTVLPLGTRGTGDDRDHRLDAALAKLKGEGDAVQLEQHARLVNFRRKLVGEMGDQVLGQPGVDFLIGEDGLPGRLVADIVAELKALRDKLLGFSRALFSRQADHVTIIGRLIGQAEPDPRRDRGEDSQAEAEPEQPFARFVHRTSRSLG